MPSSIPSNFPSEPLDILVEYGYLDDDTPYHIALSAAVNDFSMDSSLGGDLNRDYIEILQNEAKKELKLRRRKINVSKLFGRGEKKTAANTTGTSSLAVRKQTIDPAKLVSSPTPEKTQESLAIVVRGIDSIVETLKAEKKQDKKHFSFLRRMVETFKRRKEENKLEFKVFDGLKKTATKLLTPFKSAWSQFLEFIGKVLLGRVLFKILEWMGNEENQGKLQSIIKFFKDWWPTLLAGYLLFGTGFTSMAVGLVKAVAFGTVKLLGLIPKLVAALAKLKLGKILNRIPGGPLLKGALLLGGSIVTGLAVNKMMNQDKDNSDDNEDQEFKQGGFVSGPAGVDKVPARLTAGEFVMSKGAVQKYGTDTLAAMNAAGGGTNRPTPMGGYFGGGEVKSYKELLEKGGTVEDLNYGTMREINVSFPEKRSGLFGRRRTRRTNNFSMRGGSKEMNMPIEDFINMKLFDGGSKAKAENTSISSGLGVGAVKNMVNMEGYEKPDIIKPSEKKKVTAGGGQVRLGGRSGAKMRMEATKITPIEKKKVTVAYAEEKQNMADKPNTGKSGQEIPSFNVTAMRSPEKIKLLGISV